MIKLYNFDELKPEEILNRDIRAEKNVEDVVDAIIADVRARGDDALKDYALKFDGATIENLQVTQAEIDEAFAGMDPYFLETLRQAAENIEHVIDVLKDLIKFFVVNRLSSYLNPLVDRYKMRGSKKSRLLPLSF